MHFKNRTEAGKQLAEKLTKYKYKKDEVIIYAIPRGGVIVAAEVAQTLCAPLDLLITRKITHPYKSEYAIAAITEHGQLIVNMQDIEEVEKNYLKREIEKQLREIRRRREIYVKGEQMLSPKGKIVILVDDGIATGFTMLAGIIEVKKYQPQKIVVAVPIVDATVAGKIIAKVDELVALDIPSQFLGSVNAYYDEFSPVDDESVIGLISKYRDIATRSA